MEKKNKVLSSPSLQLTGQKYTWSSRDLPKVAQGELQSPNSAVNSSQNFTKSCCHLSTDSLKVMQGRKILTCIAAIFAFSEAGCKIKEIIYPSLLCQVELSTRPSTWGAPPQGWKPCPTPPYNCREGKSQCLTPPAAVLGLLGPSLPTSPPVHSHNSIQWGHGPHFTGEDVQF